MNDLQFWNWYNSCRTRKFDDYDIAKAYLTAHLANQKNLILDGYRYPKMKISEQLLNRIFKIVQENGMVL